MQFSQFKGMSNEEVQIPNRMNPETPTPPAAPSSRVPRRRFPEFQDSEEWGEKELSQVADFPNTKVHVKKLEKSNYVSTENLIPDFGGIEKSEKIPTVETVTKFNKNDILISNIRPYLKKISQAHFDGGASNDIIIVRPNQDNFSIFIFAQIANNRFIDYVMQGAKGVKMPRGDISEIKQYPVFIPSLPEQVKIAECLSSLDELIALETRKLEALKQHKRGLMQQLFPRPGEAVPRLRFPAFQESGDWEEKKLGTLGSFFGGLTGKTKEDFLSGNSKYITYMNVFSNTFINSDELGSVNVSPEENQNKVKRADVIFTTSSETQEETGMSSVVLTEINNCYVNSFCTVFRFEDLSKFNSKFIGYVLRSDSPRAYFAKKAQGAIRFNLPRSTFSELPILIPSLPEQTRIAECLSSLDELIAFEWRKLEVLKQHKRGLMQQLFPQPTETP